MDILIEYLLKNGGILGVIIVIALLMLRNKTIMSFLKRIFYKRLAINKIKLKSHSLFTNYHYNHHRIKNIRIENKLNERLFKLLLHCKNDAIKNDSMIFIKEIARIDKKFLKDEMIGRLDKIKKQYHTDFKSRLLEKYGNREKYKKLVLLSNNKPGFIDKLSDNEIQDRLSKIAVLVIEKFENQHDSNVNILVQSITDISGAFQTKRDKAEDYLSELVRALLSARRDVMTVLQNINGEIIQLLK